MYAVIKTGGKQYRVKAGDLLVVEKLDGEPGAKVAFGEVLMVGEGAAVTLGAPTVAGASVSATLIETRKGEKLKIFKKIRRQGYRRTRGHRQFESVLRVTAIDGAGQTDTWTGTVDMTTKAELNARSRNLKLPEFAAKAEAPAKAAKAPKAAAPKAIEEAAATAPVEAAAKPAKKAAAPKAATTEPTAAAPKKAAAKKTEKGAE